VAEGNTSAVDAATIEALAEDGSLLRELRDLFVNEAPEQLHRMDDGHRQGDAKAVALAAHRLKGTAATFGAEEMRRLCMEIEGLARGGSLDGVQSMIQQLGTECDRLRLALDQAIESS